MQKNNTFFERFRQICAIICSIVVLFAVGLLSSATTWLQAALLITIIVIALVVFGLAIGGKIFKRGVPTNTQLQTKPPAIIKVKQSENT